MGVFNLEGVYPVITDNQQVGTVTVKRQGLYFDFDCKCTLDKKQLYRLTLTVGDIRADLGVCVPQNGYFGLRTRLPVKRFGTGEPVFCINTKQEKHNIRHFPVCSDKPFPELSKLRTMCLVTHDGKLYLKDRSRDPQDSDQTP